MTRFLGNLFGLENVESIESVEGSLSAGWAQSAYGPATLIAGFALAVALSGWFYLRMQPRGGTFARGMLAVCRAVLLGLLLLVLAEPSLVFKIVSSPRPQLWVLFDGTDSMAIEDEYAPEERDRLDRTVGRKRDAASTEEKPSRSEYLQALLARNEKNPLAELAEGFRLRTFLFDDGVRELEPEADWSEAPEETAKRLGEKLTTEGQFTALGTAFGELARRQATASLAGLVVFSDFSQNVGPAAETTAERLGAPVHTVGVGPAAARDLRLKLEAPLWMTKSERNEVTVVIEREGIEEPAVEVRLLARRTEAGASEAPTLIGQRRVDLSGYSTAAEFPYTPEVTGHYTLEAEVDPLPGEVVDQNNRASRDVNIRDDFLRLMFVEYEPTWEWRFIKEVFHRDKLVGLRGFRTFLRSSDPKVRQYNELFLRTMVPPRSEFFANDVIFLGDMPSATISTRFAELTKEFVGSFGGGLVVMAGPRFGPGQLADSPLADMLPVVVDPDLRVRDDREFEPRLTPEAPTQGFMRLGADEQEMARAWRNLGPLPWYQPVARATDQATVLAVHPRDRSGAGQLQPLIALRQYGEGIVVYLGFNETWRLRRKHGERYYRQFWGQMIHQLASRRALGTQKRFVVRSDRQQYRLDESVTLTVEAFDADYKPLPDEKLEDGKLVAEVFLPGSSGAEESVERYAVTRRREAEFETKIPAGAGGEYRVRIKDPVTGKYAETKFTVTELSAERRSAVRNAQLQRQIAQSTGGKSYDLAEVGQLARELTPPRRREVSLQVVSLWNSWRLCFTLFCLVVLLMLGEWLGRKMLTLP